MSWSMNCKNGTKGNAVMTYQAEGFEIAMDMQMPEARRHDEDEDPDDRASDRRLRPLTPSGPGPTARRTSAKALSVPGP